MRLADFIVHEMEAILVEWEAFASTQLPAAASMKSLALRDHAEQILRAIALDLRTDQSRQAQALKARGLAPVRFDAPETAAQTHALLRAKSGFDINQLAAEYRALRASVLLGWMDRCAPAPPELADIVRFNEAIDQALAESIGFFNAQVNQSRNLLLGMLGHDMRAPLQTILATAHYLARIDAGAQVGKATRQLIDSGARIKALLDDLLDFGRTRLGLGIRVAPHELRLDALLAAELDQLRPVYPTRALALHCDGDCQGRWDGVRLQQMVENLVVNAIKYGDGDAPVDVSVRGEPGQVVIEVRNAGPTIEADVLESFFDPLRRGVGLDEAQRKSDSLGLGLYIAREVARAHGGELIASSQAHQTLFTCTLPRHCEGG